MPQTISITISDTDLPRIAAWVNSIGQANAKAAVLAWVTQQVQLYEQNNAQRSYASTYTPVAPS